MKLTIFAATGGIGRIILEQAVAAGHDVTAAVRDPRKVTANVRVVPADLTTITATELEPAVRRRRRGDVRARPEHGGRRRSGGAGDRGDHRGDVVGGVSGGSWSSAPHRSAPFHRPAPGTAEARPG